MSQPRAQFTLRTRTGVELRELTVRLMQEYAPSVAPLALVFSMPLALIAGALTPVSPWLTLFVTWWLLPLFELPTLIVVSRRVFGEQLGFRQAMRLALAATPSAIWLRLRSAPLFALANVVPLIGGMFASSAMPFLPEVSVLERARGRAAFKRAKAIGQFNDIPPSVMGVVCYAVLGLLFDFGLRAGLGSLMSVHLGPAFAKGGSPALLLFGVVVAAPFVATFRYLSYVQARMTAEGWDLRLDFENLVSAIEARVLR